jgi:hypothetical protein
MSAVPLDKMARQINTGALFKLALIVALACLLSCTQERVAGGYDDVENPALTLSFKDPQGNALGISEVKVYARFQNPALDTIPLVAKTTLVNGTLTLSDTTLVTAMANARDRGVPWPTADSIEFNIVSSTTTAESFTENFILARTLGPTYRFRQRINATTVIYPNAKGTLTSASVMKPPVLGLKGNVGPIGLEVNLVTLIIPGSPYQAKIADDGSFTIARIASGMYAVKGMSSDGKVYGAENLLNTDSSYSAANWSEVDLIWIEK